MRRLFIVYEIRDINEFSDYSTLKGLFELKSFDDYDLAERYCIDVCYNMSVTILIVFR